MSSHAATIRLYIEHGVNPAGAEQALDALLAENQRLCEALEKIVALRDHLGWDELEDGAKVAREALAGDAE